MNIKAFSIGLGVLALTGLAGQASAGGVSKTLQVRVGYADLDLNRPAGVAALYQRISQAAGTVCPEPDRRDTHGKAARKACVAHAIEGAVTAVGSPQLTRYFASMTHEAEASAAFVAGK